MKNQKNDGIQVTVIKNKENLTNDEKQKFAEFLFTHLQEYGDPIEDIVKSIDFAMKMIPSFGGNLIIAKENDEIIGGVILNTTGMKGYIPENILVYIAVHQNKRGMGIGKLLMNKAIEISEGNIALHVEADNPARFLYQKVGFEKKYDEMRFIRK